MCFKDLCDFLFSYFRRGFGVVQAKKKIPRFKIAGDKVRGSFERILESSVMMTKL